MEAKIAEAMRSLHAAQQKAINNKRKEGHLYQVGDKVWLLRPRGIGGDKTQSWWTGPYPIVGREGERSFVLQKTATETHNAHADQLKPWVADETEGQGIPMEYRVGDPAHSLPMEVENIRTHRTTPHGQEFLVHWKGTSPQEDSWEPVSSFMNMPCAKWQEYCQHSGVAVTVAFGGNVDSSRYAGEPRGGGLQRQ